MRNGRRVQDRRAPVGDIRPRTPEPFGGFSDAGFIVEEGRALVVAINKWDDLDSYSRERIKQEVARKLMFLGFAEQHFISALRGTGVAQVMAP